MAITQPSDRFDYGPAWDQRSTTCPVYNNTRETNVLPYGDLIQYPDYRSKFNLFTNNLCTNSIDLPLYISTNISRVPFSSTSVRPANCVFTLGNKGAHTYYGNIEKAPAKRKPKYPCISCGSGVVARSKAVSCDVCRNWIHIKCTNAISLDYYHKLALSGAPFDFTCNRCTLQALPFPDGLCTPDIPTANWDIEADHSST